MKLYKQLETYEQQGIYPMHMPGHKRNPNFTMKNPYQIDITEIDGFDDLQHPEKLLKQEMLEAADIYQTKQSFFLINGSTVGILAGIFASVLPGETVCVARNCHKSVLHAVMLRGLNATYLYPEFDEQYGFSRGITSSQVKQIFQETPSIRLLIITSPTYEGMISSVAEIAEVVHSYGAVLFVDEAHGAHLYFHSNFPNGALRSGADLVVHSIHKTLPSFTQTALLHRVSDRISEDKIRLYLNMFQTTSPSYILMAGIERCLAFLRSEHVVFGGFADELYEFYQKTSALQNMQVLQLPWNIKEPSKIIISVQKSGMTGRQVYDILLRDYKIHPEMASKYYVLCMTSVCDTKEGFHRLYHALYDMDRKLSVGNSSDNTLKQVPPCRVKKRMESWQVERTLLKKVLFWESAGSISGEFLYIYPPGIPLLVPGEEITSELIEYLYSEKSKGSKLQGLNDTNMREIYVIP